MRAWQSTALALSLLCLGCQGSAGSPTPQASATTVTPGSTAAAKTTPEDEPWCLPGSAADYEAWLASGRNQATGAKKAPPPPDLPKLMKDLYAPLPQTRLDAIRTLGRAGAGAAPAVEELRKALSARQPVQFKGNEVVGFQFQAPLLWALGRIGPDASTAVPDIVAIVEQWELTDEGIGHEDFAVQMLGIEALIGIGPGAAQATPLLERMAEHSRAGDIRRYQTLVALRAIGTPQALGGLARFLDSEDAPTVREALRGLKNEPALVSPHLKKLMESKDQETRTLLLEMAWQFEPALSTGLLRQGLDSSTLPERLAALRACAQAGPEESGVLGQVLGLVTKREPGQRPGEDRIPPDLVVPALLALDPTGAEAVRALEPHLEGPDGWRILDILDRLGSDISRKSVERYLKTHQESKKTLDRLRAGRVEFKDL